MQAGLLPKWVVKVTLSSSSPSDAIVKLNRAATTRPHYSHVLVSIFVLPLSYSCTLRSLKSNSYRNGPPDKLSSYQKPHTIVIQKLFPSDSIRSRSLACAHPKKKSFPISRSKVSTPNPLGMIQATLAGATALMSFVCVPGGAVTTMVIMRASWP